MLGSLYAIANGPASLATPRPALSMATFQPVGFVLGATVLLALEIVFGAAALLTAALYLFNVNKKEEGSHA